MSKRLMLLSLLCIAPFLGGPKTPPCEACLLGCTSTGGADVALPALALLFLGLGIRRLRR